MTPEPQATKGGTCPSQELIAQIDSKFVWLMATTTAIGVVMVLVLLVLGPLGWMQEENLWRIARAMANAMMGHLVVESIEIVLLIAVVIITPRKDRSNA